MLTGLQVPPSYAQELYLPKPGVRVSLSPEFKPAILSGIKINPENPFKFEFILNTGDDGVSRQGRDSQEQLKSEANRLIKYFLAGITVPEKDLWVNLSPYEKDRIVPDAFGKTEMGRDLLAQDYLLKQITASLMYPDDEIGKRFWKRIYEEAAKKYGNTKIPVNTFNKVWIVPEKASVYENAKAGTAYVVESKLKVMLETDYLSQDKNTQRQPGDIVSLGAVAPIKSVSPSRLPSEIALQGKATQGNPGTPDQDWQKAIIRDIIIPELNKEVNEGKNFAQLRQVYNSLILATWYKKKIKESVLSSAYANRNKVKGLQYKEDLSSPKDFIGDPESIYQNYLKAFKKGVFNLIREEVDATTSQIIPRKYFLGGMHFAMNTTRAVGLGELIEEATEEQVNNVWENGTTDKAMVVKVLVHTFEKIRGLAQDTAINYQLYKSRTDNYPFQLFSSISNIHEEKAFRALTEVILDETRGENDNRVHAFAALLRINEREALSWYFSLPRPPLMQYILGELIQYTKDDTGLKAFQLLKEHPGQQLVGILLDYVLGNDKSDEVKVVNDEVFDYLLKMNFRDTPDFVHQFKVSGVEQNRVNFKTYLRAFLKDPIKIINFLTQYPTGSVDIDSKVYINLNKEEVDEVYRVAREGKSTALFHVATKILGLNQGEEQEYAAEILLNLAVDKGLTQERRMNAIGNIKYSSPEVVERLMTILRSEKDIGVINRSFEVLDRWAEEGNLQVIEALLQLIQEDRSLGKYSVSGEALKALSRKNLSLQHIDILGRFGKATKRESVFRGIVDVLMSCKGDNTARAQELVIGWELNLGSNQEISDAKKKLIITIFQNQDYPIVIREQMLDEVIVWQASEEDKRFRIKVLEKYQGYSLERARVLCELQARDENTDLSAILQDDFIKILEKEENEKILMSAIVGISKYKDTKSLNMLLKIAVNTNNKNEIRIEAINGINRIMLVQKSNWQLDREQELAYISLLKRNSEDGQIKQGVVYFFSQFQGAQGVNALVDIATTPKDYSEDVRRDALTQLEGKILTEEQLIRLSKLFSAQSTENDQIRKLAIKLVSASEFESLVTVLLNLANDKKERFIVSRLVAIAALKNKKISANELKNLIYTAKVDADIEVRKEIIAILPVEALDDLLLFAKDESNGDIQAKALMTIAKHGEHASSFIKDLDTLMFASINKKVQLAATEALKSLPAITIMNFYGINMRLAIFLKKSGQFHSIHNLIFKQAIDKISEGIEYEQTSHPAEIEMGIDEKLILFRYLFAQQDLSYQLSVSNDYFRKSLQSFNLELIQDIFAYLDLDGIVEILSMRNKDPERAKAIFKERLNKFQEEHPDREIDKREAEWIFDQQTNLEETNQLVLSLAAKCKDNGKDVKDLIQILERTDKAKSFNGLQAIARVASVSVEELYNLKYLSIDDVNREELITGALIQVDDMLLDEELFVVKKFQQQSLQSQRRILMKLILMQTTDNEHVWEILNEVKRGGLIRSTIVSERTKAFIKNQSKVIDEYGELASFRQKLISLKEENNDKAKAQYKEANKQMRKLFVERRPAMTKVPALVNLEFIQMASSISLNSDTVRIPLIQFVPLMKLRATKQSLDTILRLNQSFVTNVEIRNRLATVRNNVYKHINALSQLNNAVVENVFNAILTYLQNKYGDPTENNVKDYYEEWMYMLEQFNGIIDAYLNAKSGGFNGHINDKIIMSAEEVFHDAISLNVFDKKRIKQLGEFLSGMNIEKVMARFNSMLSARDMQEIYSRWGIKNEADFVKQLRKYASENPRAKWVDHEGRNIIQLIDLFLINIEESEIYVNMFEALVAEVKGKFHEWKYESKGYLSTLDMIISIEVEKLTTEEQRKFKAAVRAVNGRSLYHKLQKIDEFQDIKDRIEQVRNWEIILTKELGDGTQAVFTDDFYYMFNIGNYLGSTACQRPDFYSELRRGLVGYLVNGTNKAVSMIKDGRVVPARRIVRLRIAENSQGKKEPIIYVEEFKQHGEDNIGLLYGILQEVSRLTRLPVVLSTVSAIDNVRVREGENIKTSLMLLPDRSTFDFSDTYTSNYNDVIVTKEERKLRQMELIKKKIYEGEKDPLLKLGGAPIKGELPMASAIKTDSIIKKILAVFKRDAAMQTQEQKTMSNRGGIDLTAERMNVQVEGSGEQMKFNITPEMIKQFEDAQGVEPEITAITPLNDVKAFLGLSIVGQ